MNEEVKKYIEKRIDAKLAKPKSEEDLPDVGQGKRPSENRPDPSITSRYQCQLEYVTDRSTSNYC